MIKHIFALISQKKVSERDSLKWEFKSYNIINLKEIA